MLLADITGYRSVSSAEVGTPVPVAVFVRNAGDEAGYIIAGMHYWNGKDWTTQWGDWRWMEPGERQKWEYSFPMPGVDTQVYLHAWHWNEATQTSTRDEERGPLDIKAKKPAVAKGPLGRLVNYVPTEEARPGAKVLCMANILNEGDQPGLFWLAVFIWVIDHWMTTNSDSKEVPPGGYDTFATTFIMPDCNVTVHLVAQLWVEERKTWVPQGDPIIYEVKVAREELAPVSLPSWLVSGLETGWLNIKRGEWVNVTILGVGLVIPPFSFTPGYWIRDTANVIVGWLNWLIDWLRYLLRIGGEAWGWAKEGLGKINDWLAAAGSWFATKVSEFWSAVAVPALAVLGRALDNLSVGLANTTWFVGKVNDALGPLNRDWEDFNRAPWERLVKWDTWQALVKMVSNADDVIRSLPRELWAFFAHPADWIFNKIDDWLNEREK